ncbi:OB-fold protein [Pedobacter sp. GSP4]|uniref:OB-fold protein n=1 Tax=Pedobacter sp. GSP4 TaxID=3453716 RepID=UPI003EE825A8
MLTPNTKKQSNNLFKLLAIVIGLVSTIFFFKIIFPNGAAVNDAEYKNNAPIDTGSTYLQSESLYREFTSNKVAFDMKHKDKVIEFEGQIMKITNDWGCANIKIRVSDNPFEDISCGNCPSNTDKWSDEVAQVTVGQVVRIKGYYSDFSSSESSMSFYKCHIIQ